MLIEFCVENHRAIREKQTLSMIPVEADDIDRLDFWPCHIAETGHPAVPRLLIDACIFGANGSGKTSFVDAMRFMTEFVRSSSIGGPAQGIPIYPFVLSPDWANRPSEFEATFICDSTVYRYGFEATQDRVIGEWLSIRRRESKKWTILFEREYNSKSDSYRLELDKSLTDTDSSLLSRTRHNALILSMAAMFNVGGEAEKAYRWLTEHFQTLSLSSGGADVSNTAERLQEEGWKRKILDFFEDFGISLRNIGAEKMDILDTVQSNSPSKQDKWAAVREMHENEKYMIYFTRDDDNKVPAPIPLKLESFGAQTLFCLAAHVIDALENGRTIVMDELNPGLHPLAFESLIAMFCDPETNTKNAQIIFTTHDPTIVLTTYVERDQVWLMEKSDSDWAARLRPLPSFKDRNGLRNFVNDYIQGRYGGVPKDTRRQM